MLSLTRLALAPMSGDTLFEADEFVEACLFV